MKKYWQIQAVANVQVWTYEQMEQCTERIRAIEKRLPVYTRPAPRISSQRKLFY